MTNCLENRASPPRRVAENHDAIFEIPFCCIDLTVLFGALSVFTICSGINGITCEQSGCAIPPTTLDANSSWSHHDALLPDIVHNECPLTQKIVIHPLENNKGLEKFEIVQGVCLFVNENNSL